MLLDEANHETTKWSGGPYGYRRNDQSDYRAIGGIIKEGLSILDMLVANPLDENATNGFKQADAKFRTAVAQNSYLYTWVLKQPPPIPKAKKTKAQKKNIQKGKTSR